MMNILFSKKKLVALALVFFLVLGTQVSAARQIASFNYNVTKDGGFTGWAKKYVTNRNWVVNFENTSNKHHFWITMYGKNGKTYGSTEAWGQDRKTVKTNAFKTSGASYHLKIGRLAGIFDNGKVKASGSWSPDAS